MKNFLRVSVTALLFLSALISRAKPQEKNPLLLVQTIPMPNVKGRIDHMDVDVKGKRLFVAGLENGSLEAVDLGTGKWSKSIPGFMRLLPYPSATKTSFVLGYTVTSAGKLRFAVSVLPLLCAE